MYKVLVYDSLFKICIQLIKSSEYRQTCIKRSPFKTGVLLRGSIHMKFYKTGQEHGDLILQVTAWAGLTVLILILNLSTYLYSN